MAQDPSSRTGAPIRILGVTKSTGGLATYNRTLTEKLHERGYDVSLVCLSDGGETYARAFAERGIPTTTMDMARYRISPISDTRLAIRLIRHLRRHPVDLVVAHGAKAGFLSRLAGRVAGVPVVYVMHSMPFLARVQGRQAFLYRWFERLGTRLGSHIVAINGSMRDELERHGIAPASAVTVIHTGIDPSTRAAPRDRASACAALGLDPGRPVVGWAGRLSPQKAPLDFVRAAEVVARSLPEVQFFMAGEGSLEEDVRALVRRLGLGDWLHLVGWQEDVASMFAAMDVYAATSRWEGLPLTLLEAMAGGRAVVATAVDGVVEVVRDGVDGLLVGAGDVPAMAARLELLLRDDDRRTELGRAARQRVLQHFTIDRMMERWEELIERKLAAPFQAPPKSPPSRTDPDGDSGAPVPRSVRDARTPRVALYLPSLVGGGAERVMLTLANAFAARGHGVDLVLARASGAYIGDVGSAVRVVDLDARRVASGLPTLTRYLRRERPQAMLSALSHANVVAIQARRWARVDTRLVVTEHNTLTASLADSHLKTARFSLLRRTYPRADAVVAVSAGVADDLAAAIGLPPERITVIYNPIVTPRLLELSRAPLSHPWLEGGQPPVVLAAGRLTTQKDFCTLIRAFALLRERRPARLLILGEGELRGALQALVAELGLAADVALPGFVANPYPWMRRASLYVSSSAWEGLPSTLIEAMACGTPVVSTDCASGPAEILENGRWGRLVPVGDVEALAAAMTAALQEERHPDVATRAADFGQDRSVAAYLEVLAIHEEARHASPGGDPA